MGASPAGEFDPAIAALIELKARRMIGHYGFTSSDLEDLQQELALHVIREMPRHDPARSSRRTYADQIVSSKLTTILRARNARKRHRGVVRPIQEAESVAGEDTRDARDTVLEVTEAMAELSEEQRAIATLFMNHTEAEVARRTGLTRQMVRTRLGQIERHLRARGLDEKNR